MEEDLGQLGWRGGLKYDSPEVVELRERCAPFLLLHRTQESDALRMCSDTALFAPLTDGALLALLRSLAAEGGMSPAEQEELVVDPAKPGFAKRAAALLNRDGHVIVKNVLDAERLAKIRAGLEPVIRKVVELDPERLGNRGSHRYSFGNLESIEHQEAWAALADPPILMAVLAEIFETEDFVCRDTMGGADFVLPGALDFQHLHSDGGRGQKGEYPDVKLGTRADGSTFWQALDVEEDPACTYRVVNQRELPASHLNLTVNWPMEVGGEDPQGQTALNGATRQIAGTQSKDGIVNYSEEPLEMKMAMVAPAPAGSALIRDTRAWVSAAGILCVFFQKPQRSCCAARRLPQREPIRPRDPAHRLLRADLPAGRSEHPAAQGQAGADAHEARGLGDADPERQGDLRAPEDGRGGGARACRH